MDSCKNVNNNGFKAVTFFQATTYQEMFRFMGTPSSLTSPTLIENSYPNINALNRVEFLVDCQGTENPALGCGCVDCPAACVNPTKETTGKSTPKWSLSDGFSDPATLIFFLIFLILGFVPLSILWAKDAGAWLAVRRRDSHPSTAEVELAGGADKSGYRADHSAPVAPVKPMDIDQQTWDAYVIDPKTRQPRPTVQTFLYPTPLVVGADGPPPDFDRFQMGCYRLGLSIANKPMYYLIATILVIGFCALGFIWFEIEEDPVALWVATNAKTRGEKDIFETYFPPSFRATQVIVYPEAGNTIFDAQFLLKIDQLTNRLRSTIADYHGQPLRFEDLCHRPLKGKGCLLLSPLQYWNRRPPLYANATSAQVKNIIVDCGTLPTKEDCLSDIGVPNEGFVVLGGFPVGTKNYNESTAVVVTLLLSGSNATAADSWEAAFGVAAANNIEGLTYTYGSQSSTAQDLQAQRSSDIVTVVASYIVFYFYMVPTLGRLYPLTRYTLAVQLKFGLAAGCMLFVISELIMACGLLSWCGVKMSLIIGNTVPFLVFAIGANNVYVLLFTFQEARKIFPPADRTVEAINASIAKRLAFSMGLTYVSLLATDIVEAVSFYMGGITRMPAVVSFSLFAGTCLAVDDVLMYFFFVPLLVLDARRQEMQHLDCFPCVRYPWLRTTLKTTSGALLGTNTPKSLDKSLSGGSDMSEKDANEKFPPDNEERPNEQFKKEKDDNEQPKKEDDLKQLPNGRPIAVLTEEDDEHELVLTTYIRKYFVPFLLHPITKGVILLGAFTLFFSCLLVFSHRLEPGLEHTDILTDGSSIKAYLTAVVKDLRVGPPVYFVIRGKDTTLSDPVGNADFSIEENQIKVCSQTRCLNNSIPNQIALHEYPRSGAYFAAPPYAWVDDYTQWITTGVCCRTNSTAEALLPPPPHSYCKPQSLVAEPECISCHPTNTSIPSQQEFNTNIAGFQASECTNDCALCGTAFAQDLSYDSQGRVVASRVWTYHIPLNTEADFINTLRSARDLAASMTKELDLDIIAYSYHYIFYEQYLTIKQTAIIAFVLCGIVITITTIVLVRHWKMTLIILILVGVTLIEELGIMALWNIQLNAVSLINLIVSTSIAIELLVHFAAGYQMYVKSYTDSREVRADMPSTYSIRDRIVAITFIRLGAPVFRCFENSVLGILVLAFAKSGIFIIYFFRMYLIIYIITGIQGFLVLPVLLSLIGPLPTSSSQDYKPPKNKFEEIWRWITGAPRGPEKSAEKPVDKGHNSLANPRQSTSNHGAENGRNARESVSAEEGGSAINAPSIDDAHILEASGRRTASQSSSEPPSKMEPIIHQDPVSGSLPIIIDSGEHELISEAAEDDSAARS